MEAAERIAVLGFGAIGSGVAIALARHGYQAAVWVRDERKIPRAKTRVAESNAWLDEHLGPAPGRGGSVCFAATAPAAADDAYVAIECIGEDAGAKASLLRAVAPHIAAEGFLATTTSGLSITSIGESSGCRDRLVGLHFWNPPELMPLVEVVRAEASSDALIAKASEFVRTLEKTPAVVRRDIPGFIGNRLLHAIWREAINLVEMGVATPGEIDLVARLTFGLRMPALGPLENMDVVGLDLIETIHEYLLSDLSTSQTPQRALSDRVARGDLGVRSGRGFYEWTPEQAAAVIERRDRQIAKEVIARSRAATATPGAAQGTDSEA